MRLRYRISCLVFAAGGFACETKIDPRPNVVLITLDTFRADRLGVLGNEGGLTPNLDALAARATLFASAVAPIGTTHPSHASMFTGLYPGEHGVRFNGDVLDPVHDTLAERLLDAGYSTACFVAKRSMLVRGGLGQGYETTSDQPGRWKNKKEKIRPGDAINEMVEEWTGDGSRTPFLLWAHYFDAHSPYRVTTYARENLGSYDGPLASGASTDLFYAFGSDDLPGTDENRAALVKLYDGEVVEVDRQVGELLAILDESDMLENAIVVVAGDHGQLLGERGMVGHGQRLWEPVLRVPFLIHDSRRPASRVVTERVSLVDLKATILDLVGETETIESSGRSLARSLRGEPLPTTPYFASVRTPRLKQKPGETEPEEDRNDVAVYHGSFKLVVDRNGERLFDVKSDAGETIDLLSDPAVAATLERLRPLAAIHQRRERPGDEPVELPPEVLEEMRELGYIR